MDIAFFLIELLSDYGSMFLLLQFCHVHQPQVCCRALASSAGAPHIICNCEPSLSSRFYPFYQNLNMAACKNLSELSLRTPSLQQLNLVIK